LLISPHERSASDLAYIYDLICKLRAFSRYPEYLRKKIAQLCFYQYLSADRVIVRQDHKPRNLYYIAHGEVDLSKVVIDKVTGEKNKRDSLLCGEILNCLENLY